MNPPRLRLVFRLVFAGALVALPVCTPQVARANDPAAAQALFTEGRRLMKLGNYVEACPKLEESQKNDPGIGTLFHLADCYEHVDKAASAWAAFLEVAAEAKAAGQPSREKVARDRAQALEGKLPHLTILVRSRQGGLEIKRDGADVGRAQWGTAVPIDAGDHKIAANAPGKKAWESTVHVPTDGRPVAVEVPTLEDAAPPPPAVAAVPPSPPWRTPATPPSASASATTAASEPPPVATELPAPAASEGERSEGSGRRTVGIALTVLGVAGAGTGAVFGVISKQKNDDSNAHCTGNVCDAEGTSLRNDAIRMGNVSTAAIVVGAVAFVGGIVLWTTAPSGGEATPSAQAAARPAQRVTAAPLVVPGGGGLGL